MTTITQSSLERALPPSCGISVPDKEDTVYSFLSKRWMTLGKSTLPKAVVLPSTEEDVVAVIKFAVENGLSVLPQCGGCGGLVITSNTTLILDMEKFRSVQVDTENATVTFGGGTLTGDLQSAVTAKGFYTGWANISAVGAVGNVLGGGIGQFQSLKGHNCDNLISARLLTGDGEIIEVSKTSKGTEKELFDQLKGAGAGFCVVLSMTSRIYPITELHLAEDKLIPEKMAMFSRDNFEAAGKLFDEAIQVAEGPVSLGFVLAVAPNSTPAQPVLIAQASYAGPQDEADRIFQKWNDHQHEAMFLRDGSSEIAKMNAQRDAMMRKVSNMDVENALMYEVSGAQVVEVANRFAKLVDEQGQKVAGATTVFHPMHSKALMKADEGRESFMCHRDREFMIQVVLSNMDGDVLEASRSYAQEAIGIIRSLDISNGAPNAMLAGNARVEADMREIFTPERIDLLKERKKKWDPNNVFWSPAVDGWVY
ncbi:FAD-binding domain-containing protein [Xylariaceae sp. FL1272]|nr:FAD-binding domain-containing protein [Xylariaceae sp. FL1272]